MTKPQSIRVVYLLGSARSGSTVLSAILGTHPEIAAVGELARITFDVDGETRICACGDLIWDCTYWHKVRLAWEPRLAPLSLDDYSKAIARYSRPAQAPRLAWAKLWGSSELRDLLDGTKALLESIQMVYGRSIIVDSSKSFTRALLYAQVPDIDLKIIHIVRDVRGFIWSNLRRQQGIADTNASPDFPIWDSVRLGAEWNTMNLFCQWAANRTSAPKTDLRYEDFVTRTRTSLLPLGEFLGVNLESVATQVEKNQTIGYGHIASGSPGRLAGPTRLELHESWRHSFTRAHKRLAWISALPLSYSYGYPIS